MDISEKLTGLTTDEIVFPRIGIDLHVNRTAFSIGSVDIQWYGVIISVGMILALVFGFSQMKKYGLNPDRVIDCVIGGIVGGIVGARAYYVVMAWEDYADSPASIFNIRQGGLAIYGGIIGSLLVGLTIAKFKKVKILPLLDIVGMSFLIGQGVGRWGNFTNQEAFGGNTTLPWGMSGGLVQSLIATMIDQGKSIDMYQTVHPCFLYESIWCILGFIVLFLISKHRKFDGQMFLLYLVWYGLGRSVIEGLRMDSLMLGNIRVSQALSVVLVLVSVILLIVYGSKVKRMGSDYTLYRDTPDSKLLLTDISVKEYNAKNKD